MSSQFRESYCVFDYREAFCDGAIHIRLVYFIAKTTLLAIIFGYYCLLQSFS
jgi:hypothetical protein